MLGRLRRFVKYGLAFTAIYLIVMFFRRTKLEVEKKVDEVRDSSVNSLERQTNGVNPDFGTGKNLEPIRDHQMLKEGRSVGVSPKVVVNQQVEEAVNYNVHAFYYAWYGNPGIDGKYYHWNHEYLPHWIAKVSAQYPTGKKHVPPYDIGSSFYPLLGPYSSMDESITRAHMLQMRQAGIGVVALSWYPPGQADDHGKPAESYVPTIFNIADEYNLKVCFHIEPYKGRSAATIRSNIKYILDMYGQHPAFYRHPGFDVTVTLPLIYVYDSYQVSQSEWRKVLTKGGEYSIRGTPLDSILIGLLVEGKHMGELVSAGFDGLYTYFASDGFSYGSMKRNWHSIAMSSQLNKMIFIPSIGPGYDDTKVRPWNSASSRSRQNGTYYRDSWEAIFKLPGVKTVSVTSFNEWHEGTQIEPAAPQPNQDGFSYLTYSPGSPDFYLQLTKEWSMRFLDHLRLK